MKQEQSGELKAGLGANKLTADQLRIRELERELSIAKTERDILMALAHPKSDGVRGWPWAIREGRAKRRVPKWRYGRRPVASLGPPRASH